MTRKKYKPRRVLLNPMEFVRAKLIEETLRAQPLNALEGQLTYTQTVNYQAFAAVRTGKATRKDVDLLVAVANMTGALAQLFQVGIEYMDEIKALQASILSMARRGAHNDRFVFTGLEMQAVSVGMEVHDAQLEVIQVKELDEAINHINKAVRAGKASSLFDLEAA